MSEACERIMGTECADRAREVGHESASEPAMV